MAIAVNIPRFKCRILQFKSGTNREDEIEALLNEMAAWNNGDYRPILMNHNRTINADRPEEMVFVFESSKGHV